MYFGDPQVHSGCVARKRWNPVRFLFTKSHRRARNSSLLSTHSTNHLIVRDGKSLSESEYLAAQTAKARANAAKAASRITARSKAKAFLRRMTLLYKRFSRLVHRREEKKGGKGRMSWMPNGFIKVVKVDQGPHPINVAVPLVPMGASAIVNSSSHGASRFSQGISKVSNGASHSSYGASQSFNATPRSFNGTSTTFNRTKSRALNRTGHVGNDEEELSIFVDGNFGLPPIQPGQKRMSLKSRARAHGLGLKVMVPPPPQPFDENIRPWTYF